MIKTVVTVSGIRPDFIRMSEVFKRLDEAGWCRHILIHTGQHYDRLLSDIFFEDLKIRKPDFNLNIGAPGKQHYQQQAELGPALIDIFRQENLNPDLILFLGDSNSVLASVPLRKEGYKIGHIEAGMRSYDGRMLEEINRKVCDHVSNILFVYHENYKKKALKEGISAEHIHVVGNTIVEPLSMISRETLFNTGSGKHIILDIHRPENFQYKNRFFEILKFSKLAAKTAGVPIKMLKFNRTLASAKKFKLDFENIKLIDLMGYKEYINAIKESKFLISDSGTAQEEPALLGVPVIVPREFTERPESVQNGNSKMLVLDGNEDNYRKYIEWALSNPKMSTDWLGSGNTSYKIIKEIERYLFREL